MVIGLILVVLCILKGLWLGAVLPWFFVAFASLKTLVEWLFLIIVSFIALLLIGRLVLRRFGRYLTLRRDPQTGDGYDINDPQDAKN
jgi:cell division protein FtsW (lipid II flippase)